MAETTHVINADAPLVGFYRGPQANLDKLTTYKKGAFYVTEDSNRLYYAQENNKLVYLNKYITTVSEKKDLPKDLTAHNIGDFYYIETENILCRYDGETYTQVNYFEPDTNTSLNAIDVSDAYFKEDQDKKPITNELWVDVSLTQKDKSGQIITKKDEETNEWVPDTITDAFKISKDLINQMVEHPASNITIGANPAEGGKSYTVALGGSDADQNTSYTVKLNKDLKVKEDTDGSLILEDESYELSLQNKTLVFATKNDEGEKSTELYKLAFYANESSQGNGPSNDDIEIEVEPFDDTYTELIIQHKDYGDLEGFTSGDSKNDIKLEAGDDFNIVTDITTSNGHVTGVTTQKVTLPQDRHVTAATFGSTDGTIEFAYNDGPKFKTSEGLYYKIGNQTFYNQANLDAGLQTYIENNLSKITNAMQFKGGLIGGTENAIDISDLVGVKSDATSGIKEVHQGDTYIVTSGKISVNDGYDDNANSIIATIGDVLIATGFEEYAFIDPKSATACPKEDGKNTLVTAENYHEYYVILGDNRVVQADFLAWKDTRDYYSADQVYSLGTIITWHTTIGTETPTYRVKWTVVPGTELNTEYVLTAHTDKLHLVDSLDYTDNAKSEGVASIELEGDSAVSLTADNDTITVSHATIDKTTNADQVGDKAHTSTLTPADQFEVITGVQVNAFGHVEKLESTKFTMPADQTNNHSLTHKNNSTETQLKNAGGAVLSTLDIQCPDYEKDATTTIDAALTIAAENYDATDSAKGTRYKISHAVKNGSTVEAPAVSLNQGNSFTVVTDVDYDEYGHVSGATTTEFTLPSNNLDVTVNSVTALDNQTFDNVEITHKLQDGEGQLLDDAKFRIVSKNEHLKVTSRTVSVTTGEGDEAVTTTAQQVELSLVWGSF